MVTSRTTRLNGTENVIQGSQQDIDHATAKLVARADKDLGMCMVALMRTVKNDSESVPDPQTTRVEDIVDKLVRCNLKEPYGTAAKNTKNVEKGLARKLTRKENACLNALKMVKHCYKFLKGRNHSNAYHHCLAEEGLGLMVFIWSLNMSDTFCFKTQLGFNCQGGIFEVSQNKYRIEIAEIKRSGSGTSKGLAQMQLRLRALKAAIITVHEIPENNVNLAGHIFIS
jgi:hypothetical protein